jgi:hypothetical protein
VGSLQLAVCSGQFAVGSWLRVDVGAPFGGVFDHGAYKFADLLGHGEQFGALILTDVATG